MNTASEIKSAIASLSRDEVEEVKEWLEQRLEDQWKMVPEFVASIERGKADIADGRVRAEN